MHKSEITVVFLAAILFTGAFTVSLPSFIIGDAEAAATEKRDIQDRDKHKSYDRYYEEYDDSYDKKSSYGYDEKYPNEKKEYYYDYYDDKYSTYEQDNIVDLECEECLKYWLYTLYKGQVKSSVNALAKYINHINWGEGVECTLIAAPVNPPDNKLPGVECLPIADADNKKKQDLAQIFEICQQIELAILYIAEKDKTDIATAFETFATGFEDAISSSCTSLYGDQLCRTAEGLLECLEKRVLPLLLEEEEVEEAENPDKGYNTNGYSTTPTNGMVLGIPTIN